MVGGVVIGELVGELVGTAVVVIGAMFGAEVEDGFTSTWSQQREGLAVV